MVIGFDFRPSSHGPNVAKRNKGRAVSKRDDFSVGNGLAVLLPAALGLSLGLLGALGWRLAVSREYVDVGAPPPNAPATDTAYFTIYDHLRYVGGPSWWPSIVVLPLFGMTIGVLTGLLTWVFTRRHRQALSVAGALAITGLLGGAGCALYADHLTPHIAVAAATDPTYTAEPPPSNVSFGETVVGGPPKFNLGPPEVLFPGTGLTVGVVSGGVLLLLCQRRNLNSHPAR